MLYELMLMNPIVYSSWTHGGSITAVYLKQQSVSHAGAVGNRSRTSLHRNIVTADI